MRTPRFLQKIALKRAKSKASLAIADAPWPPRVRDSSGQLISQRSDIASLLPNGSIGIELGVAQGMFSNALLDTGRFSHLYSVDMWAGDRSHDVVQYREAVRLLDKHRARNTALRMRFEEALPLFPDAYFDFIYIDGYAHTGQESGRTLDDWWPKLKPGGLFSGDDYHRSWPLVVKTVNDFTSAHGLELMVLESADAPDKWSRHPSWLAFKPV